MEEKDRLLKIDEVAEILGISKYTLYKRCAPGAKDPFPIKPKRVGSVFRKQDSTIHQGKIGGYHG